MTEIELELERLLRIQAPAGAAHAAGTSDPLPDLVAGAAAPPLVDVAYTTEASPVGTLLLAATRSGLVRVAYLDGASEDQLLGELAARVSPRVLAAPARLDAVRRELDQFFAGSRREFELTLDWRLCRAAFSRRVLEATSAIPYGSVSTYTEVAREAGSPRAARAAGNALGANPLPIVVPCHRVLHTGGGLGGYTGGLHIKRTLLSIEGVLAD